MMWKMAGRALLSILILGMAGFMLWYGVCTNRIAAKDVAFWREHPSTGVFPEVLLMEGNLAYHVDLDTDKAIADYKRAISMQPIAIDAWLALANADLMRGNLESARRTLEILSPLLAHVSTWKWQELLLSFDLKDDRLFAATFNFILTRLPHRAKEACYLATRFWGSWNDALPHLAPESRQPFLMHLMAVKEIDVALALWEQMTTSPTSSEKPDKQMMLRFCQFLLGSDRLEPAGKIWAQVRGDGLTGIHDGGFESKPLNMAFGWRVSRHPDVTAERTLESPYKGTYSLHLHFSGSANVSFTHVSQVASVEPSRTYKLKFARKSRNLTTDQGIFLSVDGYGCKGLRIKSEPLLGSSPWKEEELTIPVPDSCHAVIVRVRRQESLRFASKISGDYWLDELVLKEQDQP